MNTKIDGFKWLADRVLQATVYNDSVAVKFMYFDNDPTIMTFFPVTTCCRAAFIQIGDSEYVCERCTVDQSGKRIGKPGTPITFAEYPSPSFVDVMLKSWEKLFPEGYEFWTDRAELIDVVTEQLREMFEDFLSENVAIESEL